MRRNGGPWLAWVLLLAALFLIILSESGTLVPLESLLSYVVAPLERGISGLVGRIGLLSGSGRDVQALQEEVATLRSANEALVLENFRLREYQAENTELRRQLDFRQENPTLSLIGADVVERGCLSFPCGDVVGQDTNPYLRYLIINVGSRDGVAVGMPVVTGGTAMVGRIARTSPNLSYVQLINDPASRVAAMLQQSRVTGIVEGSEEGLMVMTDILPDELVTEGETIVTSSLGGLLPRGLILGQVESVAYQESELFQRAAMRPAVDFRRMETVLVITDFAQPDLTEMDTP
ncbi:MAG: rod shape-determining protein MreC [Anaerolineae bacterium]|nr:rod shape-determining protein MreC [Anaerolineae bacterium]